MKEHEGYVSIFKYLELKEVLIKKFKSIDSLYFDTNQIQEAMSNKKPLWSEENGKGKTTFLDALCLALTGLNSKGQMKNNKVTKETFIQFTFQDLRDDWTNQSEDYESNSPYGKIYTITIQNSIKTIQVQELHDGNLADKTISLSGTVSSLNLFDIFKNETEYPESWSYDWNYLDSKALLAMINPDYFVNLSVAEQKKLFLDFMLKQKRYTKKFLEDEWQKFHSLGDLKSLLWKLQSYKWDFSKLKKEYKKEINESEKRTDFG
ncbi:AAA family ATPase, partial [Mycoplasma sp. 3392]